MDMGNAALSGVEILVATKSAPMDRLCRTSRQRRGTSAVEASTDTSASSALDAIKDAAAQITDTAGDDQAPSRRDARRVRRADRNLTRAQAR